MSDMLNIYVRYVGVNMQFDIEPLAVYSVKPPEMLPSKISEILRKKKSVFGFSAWIMR